MSFTGFSSDEEGSIIYDGKKFIVTNPRKVPANFNPGKKPVIGLPADHPSLAPRSPPPVQAPPGKDASDRRNHDDSGSEDSRDNRDRQEPPARQPVKEEYAPDIKEFPDDLAASGHVTFLPHVSDEAPSGITVWQEHTPLSPGQEQRVNHLLHVETDILAREVLITVKREGMPPRSQWSHFMTQYALWSWYAESDALAWATLAKIEYSDWDEMLGFADEEAVETVAQDLGNDRIAPREQVVELRASGMLEVYASEEAVLRDDDRASAVWPLGSSSFKFRVLDHNPSRPYAVKVEAAGSELWIDLRQTEAELEFRRVDLASSPYISLRAQVSGRTYANDSVEFLYALTQAQLNPHAIGEMKISGILTIYTDEELNEVVSSLIGIDPSVPISVHEFSKQKDGSALVAIYGFDRKYWIDANDPAAKFKFVPFADAITAGASSGYELLPIVPDEKAHGGDSNIEVSEEEWADRTGRDDDPRTKRGVLSRDYNHVPDEDNPGRIHESFLLQSPVVGQDVRVEFVVRDHETLGSYVVISFPAHYYQSNDEIMRRLEMQRLAAQRLRTERPNMERFANLADHNPDRWSDDGRIFYAFAHLSGIAPHILPGEFIDSVDESIIGRTGKSGTSSHHLDLAILYFGSSEPGSDAMETELNILRSEYHRTGSNSANYFFGLAMRSQLDPNTRRFDLYGENLDSARLHPELDESESAEFMEGASIYAE